MVEKVDNREAESTARINAALTSAIEQVVGAVAAGAASAAQSAQSVAGSQGGAGATTSQAGIASQGAAADIQNKVDVSASEVIESFNVHSLKDAALANKALVSQAQSNAKLYDITATALGLMTMGATHNMGLLQQMASDHRDQNHDRQINVNETDAFATILAERVAARLTDAGK